MRHHALGPVIGQRQHRAAIGHHRRRPPRHRGEGIDGNIHRHQEVVARRFGIATAQLILVRKADGMDDEVDAVPARGDGLEQRVDRGLVRDIAFRQEIRADLCRQRLDPFLECLALIGKGQFGALIGKCLGNAPGDGFVIGQTHDKAATTLHQPHTTVT